MLVNALEKQDSFSEELSETTDVDDTLDSETDTDDESYEENFNVVQDYCGKVKCLMKSVMESCKKLRNEKKHLRKKIHDCKDLLDIRRIVISDHEKRLEEMLEEKLGMEVDFEKKIKELTCAHNKQVEEMQIEILEKQKTIDEMKERETKQANIKRLNEERVKTKKELEDMEDTLSKEIKTLQMRKIFVHDLQTKIKPANTEEDYKQKIVTKGYSLAMESITALRNDITKLQNSVKPNNKVRYYPGL